jgi:hypothetical protein
LPTAHRERLSARTAWRPACSSPQALGPAAKDRNKLVPTPAALPAPEAAAIGESREIDAAKIPKFGRSPWAILLELAFLTDALTCPTCLGRMKILAAITKPNAIRRILDRFGIPSEARSLPLRDHARRLSCCVWPTSPTPTTLTRQVPSVDRSGFGKWAKGRAIYVAPCRHELKRAVARDPGFAQGCTVPVLHAACTLPKELAEPNPLLVDLRNPLSPPGWKLLLKAVGADLGCPAERWIAARDELVTLLGRNRSVNFVVPHRDGGARPKWREIVKHLKDSHFPDLGCVDLERGAAASRRGLVELILDVLGHKQSVRQRPVTSRYSIGFFDWAEGRRGSP